jgi:hypothetical protein
MDTLAISMLIATAAVEREATSARPGAPVVPFVEPIRETPRTKQVRATLATGLRQLAQAVDPAHATPVV